MSTEATTQAEVISLANSAVNSQKPEIYSVIDQKIVSAGGFISAPLDGLVLATLGDSITAQETWQQHLCDLTGLSWDSVANNPGSNGNPPMGIGGSQVVPEIKFVSGSTTNYQPGHAPGQSIYYRADFVKNLNPNVIIVFGGQNDATPNSYDLADLPYEGAEYVTGEGNVSFVSAYKGILKKLISQNPAAKIYTMTRMYNKAYSASSDKYAYDTLNKLNDIIRQVSAMYSVECIDLQNEVGIHMYNADLYLSDNIHPNAAGGKRMAELIAKKLM